MLVIGLESSDGRVESVKLSSPEVPDSEIGAGDRSYPSDRRSYQSSVVKCHPTAGGVHGRAVRAEYFRDTIVSILKCQRIISKKWVLDVCQHGAISRKPRAAKLHFIGKHTLGDVPESPLRIDAFRFA